MTFVLLLGQPACPGHAVLMGMAESQDGKLRQEDTSQDSTAFMAAHTLLANTTHMAKFTIDGVGGYSLLLEVMGA